uniref:Uncharacterized protein n=1 Tax=Oryzias latipes TaxID=8090 RepID=A0A3P9HCZ3_ORYLA
LSCAFLNKKLRRTNLASSSLRFSLATRSCSSLISLDEISCNSRWTTSLTTDSTWTLLSLQKHKGGRLSPIKIPSISLLKSCCDHTVLAELCLAGTEGLMCC